MQESGVQPGTPWHQDQSYYPVDGQQLCSIWMPVDAIPQVRLCSPPLCLAMQPLRQPGDLQCVGLFTHFLLPTLLSHGCLVAWHLQEASLQFVRGSHAWGKWYIPRKFASGNQYECNSGEPATGMYLTEYRPAHFLSRASGAPCSEPLATRRLCAIAL